MRIVATGISGFIVSRFVDLFSPLDISFITTDIHKVSNLKKAYPSRDICSINDYIFGNKKYDTLLLGGWSTIPMTLNNNIINEFNCNLKINFDIVDKFIELGGQKIVFISSGGKVYGKPFSLPVSETHPRNPDTYYGLSKKIFEDYLKFKALSSKVKIIILRPSNIVGNIKAKSSQGVIENWILATLQGKELNLWTNTNTKRDYLYVDDFSVALKKAIEYDIDYSEFNVSSGISHSLNEIVEYISKVCQTKPRLKICDSKNDYDMVLDNSKLKHELNWEIKFDISKMISETHKLLKNV